MGLTHITTNKKYNGKELWETYMSWGAAASHRKLRLWFEEKGVKASQMGAFWAMWRYALGNPEEAFPAYKKWWFETASNQSDGVVVDSNVDFQKFLEDIRNHAYGKSCIVGRRTYRTFCKKYSLSEIPARFTNEKETLENQGTTG